MRNFIILTLVIVLIALLLKNHVQLTVVLGKAGEWWNSAISSLTHGPPKAKQ